jgi:hypothetical protein
MASVSLRSSSYFMVFFLHYVGNSLSPNVSQKNIIMEF